MTGVNLSNYCFKHLKEWIVQGDYAPGEKLHIAKLSARLKTGPTPIREALSRLTSTGLIEIVENKGFRVKTFSEAAVRDLYTTFGQIETLALLQAIDRGDTSWEADIVAALYKLSILENTQSPVNSLEWLKLNYEFHFSLIVGCKSHYLLKIRDELYQHFERYCHLGIIAKKKELTVNHQEHAAIAKAVLARDKDKTVELMSQHLNGSLESVVRELFL